MGLLRSRCLGGTPSWNYSTLVLVTGAGAAGRIPKEEAPPSTLLRLSTATPGIQKQRSSELRDTGSSDRSDMVDAPVLAMWCVVWVAFIVEDQTYMCMYALNRQRGTTSASDRRRETAIRVSSTIMYYVPYHDDLVRDSNTHDHVVRIEYWHANQGAKIRKVNILVPLRQVSQFKQKQKVPISEQLSRTVH